MVPCCCGRIVGLFKVPCNGSEGMCRYAGYVKGDVCVCGYVWVCVGMLVCMGNLSGEYSKGVMYKVTVGIH